eukprot:m.228868 g.228868  ORF g.228868 m.228868 type:complete len:835 (-) comp17618_c0_seq1:36-2540(-)
MAKIVHLNPLEFTHVLDGNTNTTRLEVGPKSLMLNDNEVTTLAPQKFIVVPPRSYCCIRDPVKPGATHTKFALRLGHEEFRLHGEPFPLFPGETLVGAIRPLPVVPAEHALHLRCEADVTFAGVEHKAGEEWLLSGPCLFVPQPFVSVVASIAPTIIPPGCALRLRAKQSFTNGKVVRAAGEEWLYCKPGAYIRHVYEEIVILVTPLVPTATVAHRIRAVLHHRDALGVARRAGEEWLVTVADTHEWLLDVTQEALGPVSLTTLSATQWCIVVNPATIKDGRVVVAWGARERRIGPATFFLQPGETLENGVCEKFVLNSDQALLLRARDAHVDQLEKGKKRVPGDSWLLLGPCSYMPPIEVDVVERRTSTVLKDNEGIYVRNMKTGLVRAIMGPKTYLLAAEEAPWIKEQPAETAALLAAGGGMGDGNIAKLWYYESSVDEQSKTRPRHAVVTYRCPPGCAVQVFNHKERTARVVLGPNMVALGPWEQFNVLSLSAGKPKVANALKSIPLILGPDAITDKIQVETSDHARLMVLYSVKYHFEVDATSDAALNRMFAVPDYIGFVARQIASRMRGAVAQAGFDQFHRHSAQMLHTAIFGNVPAGETPTLRFLENGVVVSHLDVREITPVDASMGDLLVRSVQMAISISTKSIEEAARQDALLQDQTARGRIALQSLASAQEAEKERTTLFALRAKTAAVQSCGQATAEAQARKEALLIEGQSAIASAELQAQAARVAFEGESAALAAARTAEIEYQRQMQRVEIDRMRRLGQHEVDKYRASVEAMGPKNVAAMATAKEEGIVRLLQSLGLSSTLLSDGNSPINLFHTATKLVERK